MRLISNVYPPDPLVCNDCGGPLKVSIKRILDRLGLSPPEEEKPSPLREVVPVPVDEEGRQIGIA